MTMQKTKSLPLADLYTEHGSFLWGLSYRMIGSAADAEDVVHDTFVRAMEHPPRRVDEPLRPWLVTVALNLARDVLRRRKRRSYVGPWLPSPIETDAEPSHEPATFQGRYDLIESVSFAFLLALEALTPAQRAVLILRDAFDYTVKETAHALDMSEANVKTTHHRARHALSEYDRHRLVPSRARTEATRNALAAFLRSLEARDVAAVEAVLAADVKTTTDGGGEFTAALRTIEGRDKVMRFFFGVAHRTSDVRPRFTNLNGAPAVVTDVPGATDRLPPRFTLSVELNGEERISHIYLVLATQKLSAIA